MSYRVFGPFRQYAFKVGTTWAGPWTVGVIVRVVVPEIVVSVGFIAGVVVSVIAATVVAVDGGVELADSARGLAEIDNVSVGIGIDGPQALRITEMNKKMVAYNFGIFHPRKFIPI
jgi:hypothetical protein